MKLSTVINTIIWGITGILAAILILFVGVWVYANFIYVNNTELPPGYLAGNVTILNATSGRPIVTTPDRGFLVAINGDGWKYAAILNLVPEGDHFVYNESLFPGNFMVAAREDYASHNIPQNVTIGSGKVTRLDITLTHD